LSLLGLPFKKIDVDLGNGEQKTPEFLTRNPFGQAPVVGDNEVVVADSNAILVYLASAYDKQRVWYPSDPAGEASVQRWLSIAAGPLVIGPAYFYWNGRSIEIVGQLCEARAGVSRRSHPEGR
jgi:glutathione S-transferase